MGEYYAALILIGGRVTRKQLQELHSAIEREGAGLDWGETSDSFEDLLEALEPDKPLMVMNGQAYDGKLDNVMTACQSLNLSYLHISDGHYDASPVNTWWHPDMVEPASGPANSEGDALVEVQPLTQILLKGKQPGGSSEEALMNALQYLYERTPLTVPPLEVVEEG